MFHVGDSRTLHVWVNRSDLVRYAGASTDFNEIHYSDRHAQALGLPGVVAHGMWTMGSALRIICDWVEDPAKITHYFVRFSKPVVVPDTDEGAEVVFTATVTEVTDLHARINLTAECAGENVLTNAKVEVRID